jgi:cyclopropane fatty-acyl-phospholipid synthase-like methyltransferase
MKISEQQIVEYYDTCELDYRFIWNLGQDVAMHFGYWDESTETLPQALKRENEILAEMVGIGPNDCVLDAGCGIGGSAIYLAKRFGCRVTGITLSQKQVDSATRHAQRSGVGHLTTFRTMDFHRPTFPDHSFDVVWAIESVCHAGEKAVFFKEMWRILEKGGRLIVADGFANRKSYNETEQSLMARWLRGWCVESLETVEDFLRHMQEAGFRDLAYVDATKNALPSSRRLYVLSRPVLWVAALARFMGRKMRARTLNFVAMNCQYLALTQGLWNYGIISARKE